MALVGVCFDMSSSGVPVDKTGHFELIPDEDCSFDDNSSNYSDPFKSDSEANEDTEPVEDNDSEEDYVDTEPEDMAVVESVEDNNSDEMDSQFSVKVSMFKDDIVQIPCNVKTISELIDNLPEEMKSKSIPLTPSNCHVYCGSELLTDWSQPLDPSHSYTIVHDLRFFCVQEEEEEAECKDVNDSPTQTTSKKQPSLLKRFRNMFTTSTPSTTTNSLAIDASFLQFIQDACEFLSKPECCQEGLFRLSGNFNRIRSLQDSLTAGTRLKALQLDPSIDCHNVAGLVKQRLRELPACILDYSLLDGWRELSKCSPNSPEFSSIYNFLKHLLPPLNIQILDCLLSLLLNLLPNQETTRMNASNLGTVFGPNLLFSPADDMTTTLESTTISSQIVTNLLLSGISETDIKIKIIAMARMEYDLTDDGDDSTEEAPIEPSIKEGTVLFILPIEDELDGWWTALSPTNNNSTAKVPSNYVRIERINV